MPEDESPVRGNKKKYVWYAVGAVVGLLGYLWFRNYEANKAAQTANTTLAAEPSGAMSNTTSEAPTNISTLADWMSAAQTWLDGKGADPALVQNALQAYENGSCLTQAEFNWIDQALGALGYPPDAPTTGLVVCPNIPTSVGPGVGPLPGPTAGTAKQAPRPGSLAALFSLLSGPQATSALQQGYNLFYQTTTGKFKLWLPGHTYSDMKGNNLYKGLGGPALFTWLSPAQAKQVAASGGNLWYKDVNNNWQLWHAGITTKQNPSNKLYSKAAPTPQAA